MGKKQKELKIKERHCVFNEEQRIESINNLRELIATAMYEYAKKK